MPAKTDNPPDTRSGDERWRPRYSRVEDDSGSAAVTPRPARAREPARAPRRTEARDSFSRTRRVGGAVEPCPKPIIKARWSKSSVTPNHNSNWPPGKAPLDEVPEEAKVELLVETTNVPDGTSAVIHIHHCHTKAPVRGGVLTDLVVRGNKVVDKRTGKPPQWVFEAEHLPWDPWNAPFFYFRVLLGYQGLTAETPRDYHKREKETLRVVYWHAAVGDADADAADDLSTAEEVEAVVEKLGSPAHHRATQRVFGADRRRAAARFGFGSLGVPQGAGAVSDQARKKRWGSVVRNTYAFHQASHGRVNKILLGSLNDNTEIDETDVANEAVVPSVPRYLVYLSCCSAGRLNALSLAFLTRGTEFVIGFQRDVGDQAARDMAEEFYEVWVDTHNCEPERVVDAFLQSRINARRYRPILRRRVGQPMTELEVWRGRFRVMHDSIPMPQQPATVP